MMKVEHGLFVWTNVDCDFDAVGDFPMPNQPWDLKIGILHFGSDFDDDGGGHCH